MSENCLFCKILAGAIPSNKIFENDHVMGIVDIAPMAKNHYLFLHRAHTSDICDMSANHPEQLVQVMQAITSFAKQNKLEQQGFRVVTNCGPDAGQTVFHTHFHVLFGEKLGRFGR